MKIVCIGDLLLTPEMMETAVRQYPRYDEVKSFYFGVQQRSELRAYVRDMEQKGPLCASLPLEILWEIADADVVQSHLAPLSGQVFAAAKKLKIVASNRGGTENIDVEAATARGIPVICNPAHNANAVAEMTLGMILAETRNIARCHESMVRCGRWRESFPNSREGVRELKSSAVGLIGFGEIGRRVAGLLRGFGTEVLVADPYVPDEVVAAQGCRKVELDTLLAEADIISVHARAVSGAKPVIGAEELAKMKPTAIVINTARAALVDMDALYIALKEHWIMGAAIDVFPQEPVPGDHPLLQLDNVTLSCHKGGDTVESYSQSPNMLLEELERFFSGETPRFLVNPEVLG